MKKVVVISKCNSCPFFSNEYWGYEHKCASLNRIIEERKDDTGTYGIPKDCPLPNIEQFSSHFKE